MVAFTSRPHAVVHLGSITGSELLLSRRYCLLDVLFACGIARTQTVGVRRWCCTQPELQQEIESSLYGG